MVLWYPLNNSYAETFVAGALLSPQFALQCPGYLADFRLAGPETSLLQTYSD